VLPVGYRRFAILNGLWGQYGWRTSPTPEAWQRQPERCWHSTMSEGPSGVRANRMRPHLACSPIWSARFQVIPSVPRKNVDDLHGTRRTSQVIHLHGELRSQEHRRPFAGFRRWARPPDPAPETPCALGSQLRPHIVLVSARRSCISRGRGQHRHARTGCWWLGTVVAVYRRPGW